jgi:endonuclease YncB( thermonuclease family)
MILLILAAISTGQSFTCTPIAVHDGDGPVFCAEGPSVRLAGIAAREMDGSCRSNQPCATADPISSRDYLVSLLGTPAGKIRRSIRIVNAPTLRCVSNGDGKYGRTAAWCGSERVPDLSCAMVREGMAVIWPRYWKGHRCD